MSPAEVLRSAVRRLRARSLESLLALLGVATAVATIASTLSLYRSVTATMGDERQLREISVSLQDLEAPSAGPVRRVADAAPTRPGSPAVGGLTPEDIAAARAVSPSVSTGYFRGVFSPGKGSNEVVGIVAGDYFAVFGLRAQEGALFSAADEAAGARVAVLGAGRARRLFPGGAAVGSRVTLADREYAVVGVLAPQTARDDEAMPADDSAFVPVRSTPVFERLKAIPSITFVAASIDTVRSAVAELRSYFDGRLGPDAVEVTTRMDGLAAERERIRGVLAVLLVFGGAGLVIASTNVLNVLLARAARRVRSTGIEMALGSSRAGVLELAMAESLLLAIAGSLLGLLLAQGFNALLELLFRGTGSPDGHVVLVPVAAFVSAGAALGLNALLALYPAWRASRIPAADAIRTE